MQKSISQETTVELIKQDIEANKKDISDNKEAINICTTNTTRLNDIVIATEAYQKSTHGAVKDIKKNINTLTQILVTPRAESKATNWGEWLVKNLVLILAVLICSTLTGVVVHLITSALSK